MLWPITRRGLVAVAAAFFAAMSPVPAAAQIPTSPGQRLAPTNENEQHLSDVSVEAANALGAAQAAAAHCDAKGLADAVKQLQQLEQEAASAANIAKGAGAMSLVRPEFANSIHDTIAGELKTASGLKPNCPQPNQPQAQVPGGNANPPPPPPPPPVGGFLGPKPQQVGPPNPIDDLYNQADDAVDAYWAAFDHCDKDGMKRALDRLRDIAKQAHQMHRAAEKAGKFGGLSKSDSENLMDLEDDIADFIYESQFDVPKCPVPQAVPGTGSCPAPKPGTPRESLLNQPLPWKPDLRIVPRLTYSLYSHAILDYHNTLRAEFGSPPLQWNSTLAAHALDYARTMTETGQLVHAPRAGRENERENLSLSVHGANSIQTMLDGWGMERRYFMPGIFPNVSTTGDWMRVAHYTQIVWPTTTQIGCGFYSGSRYDAFVCRYSPPGNTDGKWLVPSNPCFPIPVRREDLPVRGL